MANLVSIGKIEQFEKLPAEVRVGNDFFYLIKDGDAYKLLSQYCPHASGMVRATEKGFYCPLHFWAFDKTGECLNYPGQHLDCFPISEQDGELFAEL